jgi:subtilisin family serine protease
MKKLRFHLLWLSMSLMTCQLFCGGLVWATNPGKDGLVSVIVKLEIAPLAAYKGGLESLAATDASVTGEKKLNVRSERSKMYLEHIAQKMKIVENNIVTLTPQARVTHRYSHVFGGLAVLVPKDKVDSLANLPGVKAVYPDRLRKPDTNMSPHLIKADKIWKVLGGQSNGGEGVIVGIIDTGIWPEHPSFSDPDSAGKAYPAPSPSWGGTCEAPNDSSTPIICSNKLIGAKAFLDAYKANMGGLPVGEFDSARDANGHGTHVASTAAGNASVTASIMGSSLGTLSGVAPRAHVAMYKVCGPEGCYDADCVAAINQAVADGVDIINFSIGPTDAFLVDPYEDLDDLAFLDAYRAGVFIATSAGNKGPDPNTANHLGGWTATVAASTNNRTFANTLKLKAKGGSLKVNGVSITAGIKEAMDFVLAADYGDELCLSSFGAGTLTGKIVGCRRGTNNRVEKGYNVLQGGASGMVLYNTTNTAQGVSPDNHYLPTIHIDGPEGDKLVSYVAAHTGSQATFTAGKAKKTQGDVTADFSSRGGDGQTYGISKPDISAPGVYILAGNTDEPLDPTAQNPGESFIIMQGTSMSSPHVAGAGALLKQLNPAWTPGQIKSALMTTATTKKVFKEDGDIAADFFDVGSGRIDLQKAIKPGVTFDVAGDDFETYKADLWNVNYPSIYIPAMGSEITISRTAHSEITKESKWKLSVQVPADLSITVPSTLEIPANGDAQFSITINASAVPAGAVRYATLFMKSGPSQVHLPVTIVKAP